MRLLRAMGILLFAILFLSACDVSAEPSAQAVENYLNALVSQDSARLSNGVCQDWETQALVELDAFQGVTASLDAVSCQKQGMDGAAALITCTGNILATYNNEQQELSVEGRTYQVVEEGGEWRVCGYR